MYQQTVQEDCAPATLHLFANFHFSRELDGVCQDEQSWSDHTELFSMAIQKPIDDVKET